MKEPSKPSNGPERSGEPTAPEAAQAAVQAAVQSAVDRRVRAALEPPPGSAERIARRALSGDDDGDARPARPSVVRPAVAVAGLALAAAALAALLLLPRLDGLDGVEPESLPGASARYSITNRGEVMVVQALDGGPSALRSTRPLSERPTSPPGMKIIVLGGARP